MAISTNRLTAIGTTPALIAVVDDDASVRESLPDLLRELGFNARAFSSAEELLDAQDIAQVRCQILDIGLPGMSGVELRRELIRRGRELPTVFITGRGRESIPPAAFDQKAVTYLFKPFSEGDLRIALEVAFGRNATPDGT